MRRRRILQIKGSMQRKEKGVIVRRRRGKKVQVKWSC